MRKIVTLLIVLAGLAALAYPVALVLDATAGRDVAIVLNPKDEDTRELELFQLEDEFEDADATDPAYQLAVVNVYGAYPNEELVLDRILFADESRIVVPEQLEGTGIEVFLRTEEHYPLQAVSVRYPASIASVVGLIGFIGLIVVRSKMAAPAGTEAAAAPG